jgi:hypothetical protein
MDDPDYMKEDWDTENPRRTREVESRWAFFEQHLRAEVNALMPDDVTETSR